MYRGFKARAESDSSQLRRELGLTEVQRLNPFALADYLGVPVFSLQRLLTHGANPISIAHLKGAGYQTFSAATITDASGFSIIVHNESHASTRQVSSVCHELAHVALGHDPRQIISADGQRYWDSESEAEAEWFGAALLVPRAGALHLLDGRTTLSDAAALFGVSERLMTWRVNQTGVQAQLRRRAALRQARLVGSHSAAAGRFQR